MKKKIILFILITILISSCYKKKEKTFICKGNKETEAGSANREDNSVTLGEREVNSSTFVCLGSGYSKDKNSVYLLNYKIKGADPKTFEYVVGVYSKDKNKIFYADKEIKKADFETFEIINVSYSKDKSHVYYEEEVIKEADAGTFKLVNKSDFYFKDKNYVYFGGKVLPDSDVRTFIVHDELQVKKGIYYKAEDKNNYYEYGKAVLEK